MIWKDRCLLPFLALPLIEYRQCIVAFVSIALQTISFVQICIVDVVDWSNERPANRIPTVAAGTSSLFVRHQNIDQFEKYNFIVTLNVLNILIDNQMFIIPMTFDITAIEEFLFSSAYEDRIDKSYLVPVSVQWLLIIG